MFVGYPIWLVCSLSPWDIPLVTNPTVSDIPLLAMLLVPLYPITCLITEAMGYFIPCYAAFEGYPSSQVGHPTWPLSQAQSDHRGEWDIPRTGGTSLKVSGMSLVVGLRAKWEGDP
jgi:hypothetical protein